MKMSAHYFHSLGDGEGGCTGDLWIAWGMSDTSPLPVELWRLRIKIIYGARSEDQGREGWWRLTVRVRVLLHSLVACLPMSEYPVGWPACPHSSCCFLLQLCVTGPGVRGGEKSLPSGTVGSAWSEMRVWGSYVPLHQWQDCSASDDTLSTGEESGLCLIEIGQILYFLGVFFFFYVIKQFLIWDDKPS